MLDGGKLLVQPEKVSTRTRKYLCGCLFCFIYWKDIRKVYLLVNAEKGTPKVTGGEWRRFEVALAVGGFACGALGNNLLQGDPKTKSTHILVCRN